MYLLYVLFRSTKKPVATTFTPLTQILTARAHLVLFHRMGAILQVPMMKHHRDTLRRQQLNRIIQVSFSMLHLVFPSSIELTRKKRKCDI